jgi:very-short-patch-repair endonuclease
MQDNREQQRVYQGRIRQVFEFLKALNDHRNPTVRQIKEQPWLMWIDELPDHPAIKLPLCTLQSETTNEKAVESHADDYRLLVKRPALTPPPLPPTSLREWLLDGWDDPNRDAQFITSINQIMNGETVTIKFGEDPSREASYGQWKQKRETWRQAELPARRAMAVFEKLYELHGKIKRESERYDLVIGDGLLSWQQPDGNMYHPLLLQRVQLHFDPQIPEFRVVDANSRSEFYTSLFQTTPDVDPRMLAARVGEFEAGGYHPLSVESNAFLTGFVNQLSAQGTFIGNRRPEPGAKDPTIGRGPVLFLRLRTKGYGNAISQVLESMSSRDDFCQALQNIVGSETHAKVVMAEDIGKIGYRELPQHDVLFGKEANQEQFRIARQLDRHGAVLVQGPPGTGKSHTIANLIGHLLAHNQSVLVTSHTTKALRVLRDHVVEDLRPLCVSLLDNDLDSRRELEESVLAISRRLSETDPDQLEREANFLLHERNVLLDEFRSLQEKLSQARADEYRDVVYAGKSFKPSDAARQVAAGREKNDWIPYPIALGEPLPLPMHEVRELYQSNSLALPIDDHLIESPFPESKSIPSPEKYQTAVESLLQLQKNTSIDKAYWPGVAFPKTHVKSIRQVSMHFREAIDEFKKFQGWCLAAINAGRLGEAVCRPWEEMLKKNEELKYAVSKGQLDRVRFRPEITEQTLLDQQLDVAVQIVAYLSRGNKLGTMQLLLNPNWKTALNTWRILGRKPGKLEEFSAIEQSIRTMIARTELSTFWDGLMSSSGERQFQELGDDPERVVGMYVAKLKMCLSWWNKTWEPLKQQLTELGFDWSHFLSDQPPDFSKHGEMLREINAADDRLLKILEGTKNYIESIFIKSELDRLVAWLASFQHLEVTTLHNAVRQNDIIGYREAHARCIEKAQCRIIALRRRELIKRLRQSTSDGTPYAQAWADSIIDRAGLHGSTELPGDVCEAWEWRQLNDELERRNQVNLEEISQKIETTRNRIKDVTVQLIDRRAWAAQVRRTSLRQKQALMGWLGIINRIGKGFGIRVPKLRQEAQQKMEECRDAVPVWIMPLARIMENFDFSAPRFDVVIIDEASQCDAMALLALAIGKKVVVVGDDKQVSPLAVGQRQEFVDNLIKLHLDGIPNAVLYDGRMSIYDLAKQSFPGMICLVEHFRCVPDIIQFSNNLCYEGDIKPLRESSSSAILPNVMPYRVNGNYDQQRKINMEEALAIASLISAATKHIAYTGQTFGVISLVGDEQAYRIDQLLRTNLTPEEYEQRRIICGNAAQFQGDERGIMFLSMVHSASEGPLPLSDRSDSIQRYNVAASRARNQMWVVHSLDPVLDLKPGDVRRRLIQHAQDPSAIVREIEENRQITESVFERKVLERLVQKGFRVIPQKRVGCYRIDLVVEGGNKQLAIECDGDRYHPIEKIPEDMERQAVLERLGWRFMRIRGSAFFRNPDQTMENVFLRLSELGIDAEGSNNIPIEQTLSSNCVVEEVIQHAAKLRFEWQTVD